VCTRTHTHAHVLIIIFGGGGGFGGVRGRAAGSIKAFQRAVSLNPAAVEGYNNLGAALDQAGRPEEAISAYTAAFRLHRFGQCMRRDAGEMREDSIQ
jgi:hypothetical protein